MTCYTPQTASNNELMVRAIYLSLSQAKVMHGDSWTAVVEHLADHFNRNTTAVHNPATGFPHRMSAKANPQLIPYSLESVGNGNAAHWFALCPVAVHLEQVDVVGELLLPGFDDGLGFLV